MTRKQRNVIRYTFRLSYKSFGVLSKTKKIALKEAEIFKNDIGLFIQKCC